MVRNKAVEYLYFSLMVRLAAGMHLSDIVLEKPEAHQILDRRKRNNDGFLEESTTSNVERECLEETCSQEEATEAIKVIKKNGGEEFRKFVRKVYPKDQVTADTNLNDYPLDEVSTDFFKVLSQSCYIANEHFQEPPNQRLCNSMGTQSCEQDHRRKTCVCKTEVAFWGEDFAIMDGDYCADCSKKCQDPENGSHGKCARQGDGVACECQGDVHQFEIDYVNESFLALHEDPLALSGNMIKGKGKAIPEVKAFETKTDSSSTSFTEKKFCADKTQLCQNSSINTCRSATSQCIELNDQINIREGLYGFYCLCNKGINPDSTATTHPAFDGPNCSNDFDECQIADYAAKCENGSTCKNLPGTYECECLGGWEGLFCSKDVDECHLGFDKCMNGSTCKNLPGTYGCECLGGWEGQFCSNDVDECHVGLDKCMNGSTCKNLPGSYECQCLDGWGGQFCGDDLDECQIDENVAKCKNGSSCRNLPGTFECDCPEGFTGSFCESCDEGFEKTEDVPYCIKTPSTETGGWSIIITLSVVGLVIVLVMVLFFCYKRRELNKAQSQSRQQKSADGKEESKFSSPEDNIDVKDKKELGKPESQKLLLNNTS